MKISLFKEYFKTIELSKKLKISDRAIIERIRRKLKKGHTFPGLIGEICNDLKLCKKKIMKQIVSYDQRIKKLKKNTFELYKGYKLTKLEKLYLKNVFLTNLNN